MNENHANNGTDATSSALHEVASVLGIGMKACFDRFFDAELSTVLELRFI